MILSPTPILAGEFRGLRIDPGTKDLFSNHHTTQFSRLGDIRLKDAGRKRHSVEWMTFGQGCRKRKTVSFLVLHSCRYERFDSAFGFPKLLDKSGGLHWSIRDQSTR